MSRILHQILIVVLLVCAVAVATQAQDDLENKMCGVPNKTAIVDVTIDDFAWMTGRWECESFGGIGEDVWAPPVAGSMVGLFRQSDEKGISFYEIITLGEQDGVFMMRLKHFHANLHGWETKDETVDFVLKDIGENIWYFGALTLERKGDDAMSIYVRIKNKQGTSVVPFHYKRTAD